MGDDEIYDVAPAEEKSAGFKNILSHFQEQATKTQPSARPKPVTKPKPLNKPAVTTSTGQPELPAKQLKSPGHKLPILSQNQLLGAKQVLQHVPDKRASAAGNNATNSAKPPPPKSKPPPVGVTFKEDVKVSDQNKENTPVRTIVLIQHGKPGSVVTDSSGKKYRLKPPPNTSGPPPKKPPLPTNFVIPDVKVLKPRANITASLIDDDELYDEVGIPENPQPRSSVRPVSLIPEYTEDEELADNDEEMYDECESKVEAIEEDEDLYETFPDTDDGVIEGYSKVSKTPQTGKAPRVVSTAM